MTLIGQVPGRLATARVKTRENIATFSPEKLAQFRAAVAQFVQRSDTQGYEFYAGWHGVPLGLCEHHNDFFLPWHRGYLYYFELALQQFDADVTLPWWDWMSDGGVPDAYDAQNANGDPNPLFDAPIAPMGVQPPPDMPDRTVRDVGGAGPAAVPPPLGKYNDWLIAHQKSDGNWNEHYYTGTGFPRVFYLMYHYYRLYFPLTALARFKRLM